MSPLLTPPPWTEPLPPASPPTGMRLYQLPTGTYQTRAAFAVKGGSFADKRQFAATAVLITHPNGDLLIDAGFGAGVERHIGMLSRFERAPHRVLSTADQQLTAGGYDRSRLLGVLVTHVHWDHVSGLDGLDVPVWITREERAYGAEDAHGAVFRSVSVGLELHEYGFDGPPYLGFPASYDVHRDGSVVVVPAGGHTSGSVVIFVAPPDGPRYAFIGDLTWQLDGIEARLERPWLLQKLADVDPAQVRVGLLRSIALSRLIRMVPAHDVAAYAGIPPFPAR